MFRRWVVLALFVVCALGVKADVPLSDVRTGPDPAGYLRRLAAIATGADTHLVTWISVGVHVANGHARIVNRDGTPRTAEQQWIGEAGDAVAVWNGTDYLVVTSPYHYFFVGPIGPAPLYPSLAVRRIDEDGRELGGAVLRSQPGGGGFAIGGVAWNGESYLIAFGKTLLLLAADGRTVVREVSVPFQASGVIAQGTTFVVAGIGESGLALHTVTRRGELAESVAIAEGAIRKVAIGAHGDEIAVAWSDSVLTARAATVTNGTIARFDLGSGAITPRAIAWDGSAFRVAREADSSGKPACVVRFAGGVDPAFHCATDGEHEIAVGELVDVWSDASVAFANQLVAGRDLVPQRVLSEKTIAPQSPTAIDAGDGWLAAWIEATASGPDNYAVRLARTHADGTRTERTMMGVDQPGAMVRLEPAGDQVLLVLRDQSSSAIVRLDRDGNALDEVIRFRDRVIDDVAADGRDWLLLARSGEVMMLLSGGKILDRGVLEPSRTGSRVLAPAGSGYAVVWRENVETLNRIVAGWLDREGRPLSEMFVVTGPEETISNLMLACEDNRCLIGWTRDSRLHLATLHRDGTVARAPSIATQATSSPQLIASGEGRYLFAGSYGSALDLIELDAAGAVVQRRSVALPRGQLVITPGGLGYVYAGRLPDDIGARVLFGSLVRRQRSVR